MDRRRFLSLTTASSFSPSLALFPTAVSADDTRRHTISYGPASLDIMAPNGKTDLPMMIYVHGGGWRIGSRTHVRAKPAFFNSLGMVFVSIDYRTLPKASITTQASDVSAAIHWVKNNIAPYGGDSARLSIMGHSAGAHLAALSVIGGIAPNVSALICNDIGAYDLAALAAARGGELPRITKAAFPDPSQWSPLSPATYVGRSNHPPTMLLWSRVKHHAEMAQLFAQKLRAAGTPVTTFAGPKMTHNSINKSIGTGNPARLDRAISEFLTSYL